MTMARNGVTNKTVVVSGYFVWLHIGHLELFREAKKFGDLIIIINNDKQQILKYGKVVISLKERAEIIKALNVGMVVKSIDDDRTVCKTLERLKPDVFCNGGDRTSDNIPEVEVCERMGIQMIFGLGNKIQSSSNLLKIWNHIKN